MGLLHSLFRAATPDNPRFSLNDPEAWDTFLDGRRSAAGVRVNRELALCYAPWWRGINLLSNDVAKLPLAVYANQKPMGKTLDPEHPGFYLLRRKPNDWQTAGQLKKQLTAHALAHGNGYAYISRLGNGTPFNLSPLSPDATYPIRENGVLWYVTQIDGDRKKIPYENVLHIKGLGFDGLVGYSVYDKAREALGFGIGAAKYGSVFFRNQARPNVVLETPARLQRKELIELREEWERMQSGLENAHRTAVLHSGLKAVEMSVNAKDAQLLQSREFQAAEIALFIGVPAHKLGASGPHGYGTLEQENQSYLDESLDPWLVTWEEECEDKLLTEEEKRTDSHCYQFNRRCLVRANLVDRANYWSTALGGRPWALPDEAREEEGMNPLGGEASTYMNPLNMGQGGDDNDPKPPGKDKAAPDKPPDKPPPKKGNAQLETALKKGLADAAARMVRRVAVHAERAAKDPKGYLAWVGTCWAEHGPVFADALAASEDACRAVGANPPSSAADWLLVRLSAEYADLADDNTAKTLLAAVQARSVELATELPSELVGVFFGYSEDQERDDAGRFGVGGGAGKDRVATLGDRTEVKFVPHPNQRPDEVTIMADPHKVDQSFAKDAGYYIAPGGAGAIHGRREGVEAFMKKGEPLQASRTVMHEGEISFTDGRHRFSVLRDKGADKVALTVPREQKKEFLEKFGVGK